MLRPAIVVCACALLFAACGGKSGYGGTKVTSTPASTAVATGPGETPAFSGLIDDVINLAVQLNTMTHDQAVCVFEAHPSIYQEFLAESGLNQSGSLDEVKLKQQLEDLKRKYPVQLDDCFTEGGGSSTPAPNG